MSDNQTNQTNQTNDGVSPACGRKICQAGGDGEGVLVPSFAWEKDLHPAAGFFLYAILLFWFLLGAAIGTDLLMCAAQRITSQRARRLDRTRKRHTIVRVWNVTIANLTLLAVAGSAPVLLFAFVEFFRSGMFPGDIGPATVLGTSGFNLLAGGASCIVGASFGGGPKQVRKPFVFAVIVLFTLLSFVVVYVVTEGHTPDVVEIGEACGFLAVGVVMLGCAYVADVHGGCCRRKSARNFALDMATLDDLAELDEMVAADHGAGLHEEEVADILLKEYGEQPTAAHWRKNAMARLSCARPVRAISALAERSARTATARKERGASKAAASDAASGGDALVDAGASAVADADVVTVQLVSARYAVLPGRSFVELRVRRSGPPVQTPVNIDFVTRDGTATTGKDYECSSGRLNLDRPGRDAVIWVKLLNRAGGEAEGDRATSPAAAARHFFFDLKGVSAPAGTKVALGATRSARVSFGEAGVGAGCLGFEEETVAIPDAAHATSLALKVLRRGGAEGAGSCRYFVEAGSAEAGLDFEAASGIVAFAEGQLEDTIIVKLYPRHRMESVQFRIRLRDVEGGVTLQGVPNGKKGSCKCTVELEHDQDAVDRVARIAKILVRTTEREMLGYVTWRDQVLSSLLVGGGNDEAEEAPSLVEYFLHFMAMFWKFLFSLVPPTEYGGGWPAFFCTIPILVLVVILIGDMTRLVACILHIPEACFGVTFVAVGFALPTTVSCAIAAKRDPLADASLSTLLGECAVTIFLGLGLPWLVGAAYWEGHGGSAESWSTWVSRQSTDIFTAYPQGAVLVAGPRGALGPSSLYLAASMALASFVASVRWVLGLPFFGGFGLRETAGMGLFLALLWDIFLAVVIVLVIDNRPRCS